jgi:hypothetical protein
VAWAPDYVTAADLKSYLEISDTVDDTFLGTLATAASRAVDQWANRQFGQAASAVSRTYRDVPFYNPATGLWEQWIDDLQDLTGLTVDGIAFASSGAVLLPDNALLNGQPYVRIGYALQPIQTSPGVTVTHTIVGKWGWSAVPSQVVAACRIQAARWNFRRNAPAGVAGSPDSGSEVRLLSRLDPDVSTTLAGLQRTRRAG